MFNNACVQILQKTDKPEFKALCAFIDQRLSDKNKEYLLFKYLSKCYPNFKSKDLAPEKLIALLFGTKEMANAAKSLSNIGNSLTKIMEEHIATRALKKSWDEYEFLLAFEYSRMGLMDLLDKKIESYLQAPKKDAKQEAEQEDQDTNPAEPSKKQENTKGLHVWYYWNLYRMYHLRFYARDNIKTAPGEPNLALSKTYQEQANLAARLRIALEMASQEKITGKMPSVTFSNDELEKLKASSPEKELYIFLYSHAYDLIVNPNDEKFYAFKTLLLTYGKQLSKDEHGNLLTPLINYASRAVRNRQNEFYAQSSFLHNYGLDTGVLLQDGKITPELLLSVVSLSCDAGDVDKAESLLNKWKDHLPKSLREEALVAAEGRIQFYKQDYEEAAGQFYKIKRYSNHLMELSARTTNIQSYYELGEYIFLENATANFGRALNRSEDRFSQQHRDSFGNFVKMVQAILNANHDLNTSLEEKRKRLQQKMDNYTLLVCINWLEQKIEMLK